MKRKIKLKDIRLVCTCDGSPEQYDVYNKDELIGYIRYRWGCLSVHPYKKSKEDGEKQVVWDKDIYCWCSKDNSYFGNLREYEKVQLEKSKIALVEYLRHGTVMKYDDEDDTKPRKRQLDKREFKKMLNDFRNRRSDKKKPHDFKPINGPCGVLCFLDFNKTNKLK